MAAAVTTETAPAAPSELPVCRPRPAEDGRILVHILLILAALAALRQLWRLGRRRRAS